jgi:ribosomal protein S18 acetylase RimI-like enzyme
MTAPTVDVRRVAETEWAEYRDLRLDSRRSDPRAFGSTLGEEPGFDELHWKSRLRSPASATWAAVDPGGRFEGMTVAAKIGEEYWRFAMWVRPEYRGQRMAARLLDTAIAWVGEVAPRAPIRLDVTPKQEAAVRLYRSRGFEITGRSKLWEPTPGERADAMVRKG